MKKRNTDLSFLIGLKWNGKNHAWLKKSRAIVNCVKKFAATKSQPEIAQMLGMSTASLINHLTEFRKVAEAKMTLEQYAESGRKFSQGNKVVATKGKKS